MLSNRCCIPKLEIGRVIPSFLDRQKEAFPGLSHLRPPFNGLNGPAFEASGLSFCVFPMNTLFMDVCQFPGMTLDNV